MLDPNLTLAIPVFRNLNLAIQKVQLLRQMGFRGPIVASVNGAPMSPNSRELESFSALNCQLFVHQENLGLYGNFKFLADIVQTSHFAWVAIDDIPPLCILNNWIPEPTADLMIGNIETRLFSDQGHGELLGEMSSELFFSMNPFSIHPSFIFGVWKVEFLKRSWPSKSMDWLDTYLLLRARLEGKVVTIPDREPWVIGAIKKDPHRVNGRFHSPIRWGFEVLRLSSTYRTPRFYRYFLRASVGRILFSVAEFLTWIMKAVHGTNPRA